MSGPEICDRCGRLQKLLFNLYSCDCKDGDDDAHDYPYYLQCDNCGDPALWLRTMPPAGGVVYIDASKQYTSKPIGDTAFCDACGRRVTKENLVAGRVFRS